jgi:hypothetical protein
MEISFDCVEQTIISLFFFTGKGVEKFKYSVAFLRMSFL